VGSLEIARSAGGLTASGASAAPGRASDSTLRKPFTSGCAGARGDVLDSPGTSGEMIGALAWSRRVRSGCAPTSSTCGPGCSCACDVTGSPEDGAFRYERGERRIGVDGRGCECLGIAAESSLAADGGLAAGAEGCKAPGIAAESSLETEGARDGGDVETGACAGSAQGSRAVAAGRGDRVASGRCAGGAAAPGGVDGVGHPLSAVCEGALSDFVGLGHPSSAAGRDARGDVVVLGQPSSPAVPPTSGRGRLATGGATGRGGGAADRAAFAAGLFASKRGGSVCFLT
jgi:hypothetical protein